MQINSIIFAVIRFRLMNRVDMKFLKPSLFCYLLFLTFSLISLNEISHVDTYDLASLFSLFSSLIRLNISSAFRSSGKLVFEAVQTVSLFHHSDEFFNLSRHVMSFALFEIQIHNMFSMFCIVSFFHPFSDITLILTSCFQFCIN